MNKYIYWDENLLSELKKLFEENNQKWINEDYVKSIELKEKELNNSRLEYKNNFNKWQYYSLKFLGLPCSVLCLCIPFYWAWKKYKVLDNEKKTYLSDIQAKTDNKLSLHKEIFKAIDFLDIFKNFNKIISYKNCGPINFKLIENIKANSLFDFDENVNTYNSSWGLLDNKIVLHCAKQTHEEYLATYSGSVSVSYYDSDSQTTRYDTVTASIQRPAYKIEHEMRNYMLMLSCDQLEFNFVKESGKIRSKFFNKKNNYSPLENKKFDSSYDWYRTDDIQFRMIFTPYTQEQYLINAGTKNIAPCYQWNKTKNFIYSELYTDNNIGDINNFFNNYKFNFLENANINLVELKTEIFDFVTAYYLELYITFNYYWLSTLLKSENHDHIIKPALDHKYIEQEDQFLYFHYILWMLDIKAIYSQDIDTFHNILLVSNKTIGTTKIYDVTYQGITYDIIKKVTYVPEYSYYAKKTVSVPINYNDYILRTGELTITCGIINTKYFYYKSNQKVFTNISDENILDVLNKINNIFVKDNIFATSNRLDETTLTLIINFLTTNNNA